MMGGNVAGEKIMVHYPDDLTEESKYVMTRGRVVPTTAWDYIWNGVINGWESMVTPIWTSYYRIVIIFPHATYSLTRIYSRTEFSNELLGANR